MCSRTRDMHGVFLPPPPPLPVNVKKPLSEERLSVVESSVITLLQISYRVCQGKSFEKLDRAWQYPAWWSPALGRLTNAIIFVTMATESVGTSLNDIKTPLNWPTSKTPVWHKNLRYIYYTCRFIGKFAFEQLNICSHGNRGRAKEQIWMTSLNWPTQKTPTLVQESRTYLLYKSSGLFVKEILLYC